MNKFKNGTLYIGNIMRVANEEITLAKENAFLIYSKQEDCFYTLDVLNYLLDLETNKKLKEEQIKEYTEIVEANKYQYKEPKNKQIYIDEKSICVAFPKQKKSKK